MLRCRRLALCAPAATAASAQIGANPTGVIDGKWYAKSRLLLLDALDFIEAHNIAISGSGNAVSCYSNNRELVSVPVFQCVGAVDYPRRDGYGVTGGAGPWGHGLAGVAATDSGSAAAGAGAGVGAGAGQTAAAASTASTAGTAGTAATPTPPPKFELAAFIHPALQGRDFEPLKEGSPLFMALDGR